MQAGTVVRIKNPHSVFHHRLGVLLRYVWPEMLNPAVVVRLIPDDGGLTLPCHLDELERYIPGDEDAPMEGDAMVPDADCAECRATLGPPQAYFFDGAYLSCRGCRAVSQVSVDRAGRHLTWVGSPCGYCGRLTDDGGPCDAPCGSAGPHSVHLEEITYDV